MTTHDRKTLRKTAARRLNTASYKPRRLYLIHSGITLGAMLLMAVIQYVLNWQIDANGGGLSGLQLRSILETIQIVLSIAYMIFLPFWTMGAFYAAVRLARGKSAYPHVLLEGFRRRGPVLRLMLMEGLIYAIITVAAMYGAWIFYGMTPDGQAFGEAMMKLIEMEGLSDSAALIEAIPDAVMDRVARGYLPVFGVVWAVLIVPATYRLRLAPFVLMDKERTGAWKAIRISGRLTRRKWGHLLLLDLGYCWYYLIPLVLAVPAYADLLLEYLQIQVPVDPAVVYMAGNALYVVLTLIFQCLAKPRVQTTYALAYDLLREEYEAAHPQPAAEEAQ